MQFVLVVDPRTRYVHHGGGGRQTHGHGLSLLDTVHRSAALTTYLVVCTTVQLQQLVTNIHLAKQINALSAARFEHFLLQSLL